MSYKQFHYRVAWALLALVLCSSLAYAQSSGVDLQGQKVNPFTTNPGKVVVLVFIRLDCPVSARYAPVLQQISGRYKDKASFWLVYPDKKETAPAIRKSISEYGYRLPALRDPDHALAQLSRVQITPEVAVFDSRQHLIYDGRIDDWFIELGRARPAPTTHELEEAIRAASAGRSLAHNE